MQKYALAYAMNDSLPVFTKEDLNCLTHINLAFGLVKGNELDMSMLTNIGMTEKFRQWRPEIKIILSVGGWGAGGFSEMSMTAEGRESFARSCLEAVERFGLDEIGRASCRERV